MPWTRPTPTTPMAFVSNSRGNSISVLDLAAQRVVATVPVPVLPLSENGPLRLAIDPTRATLLVPLAIPPPIVPTGPHGDHGAAPINGVLIKRDLFTMRLLGRVELDHNPSDMVLSRDRRRAYVAHYDLARARAYEGERAGQLANVIEVDLDAMTVVRRIPTCVAPQALVLGGDGRTLYVACTGDDAVAVLDLATPAAVRVVPIDDGAAPASGSPEHAPRSLAISPDGRRLWVGLGDGPERALLAFDTSSERWLPGHAARSLPGFPRTPGISADGAVLVVPTQNQDAVAILRDEEPTRVERNLRFDAETCSSPQQVARGPDGLFYVVCGGVWTAERREPGAVLALHPDDYRIVARYPVGYLPDAIVFSPGVP